MTRPLRLDYPGATCLVTGRAKGRNAVFRDATDRKRFLSLLGTIAEEDRWRIHGYALLRARYELLVELPVGGLSHGMRSLTGRYTQWFNRRHGRSGSLYDSRFKAVFMQKDDYLLDLSRHVAWSPVRDGLARKPEAWPWSHYKAMSGEAPAPAWLETNWTLSKLGRGAAARKAWRRFVAEGREAASPLENVRRQAYLGDNRFVERARTLLASREPGQRVQRRRRGTGDTTLTRIQRLVADEWGVSVSRLRRHGGESKVAGLYLARKLTPLSNREIGDAFGVGEARVSSAKREVEEGARQMLLTRLDRLRRRLSSAG
ncbi:MAG TPA: addiction module toxin RelE [Thermoanaerobaculia bacterium]|nr:addiction module toxin RelE [Thermoanaerobaculia bacterium]